MKVSIVDQMVCEFLAGESFRHNDGSELHPLACYKQGFLDAVPLILEMARETITAPSDPTGERVWEHRNKYPDAASIVEELTRGKRWTKKN